MAIARNYFGRDDDAAIAWAGQLSDASGMSVAISELVKCAENLPRESRDVTLKKLR
jgi:hypothetical protein